GVIGIDTMTIMTGTKKADAAYQFINLALSKDIQAELVKSLKAGPTVIGTPVPANLAGQPGIFVSPAQWKERAYIINDEVRAKNLPAWREWFTSNIVKKEPDEAPARPCARRHRGLHGGAGVPPPVQRAGVRAGFTPDGRLHPGELPHRDHPAVPRRDLGHGVAVRRHHRPHPRRLLPRRLYAGPYRLRPGALDAPRPDPGAVLHGRHRAYLRLDPRPRQRSDHLAHPHALHGAWRAGRSRALFHADHDPHARRGDQPHRSRVRARGGEPGCAARPRILARDPSPVRAGDRVGESHRLRVDPLRLSDARPPRRRKGADDRHRGEGPRARLLQLAG